MSKKKKLIRIVVYLVIGLFLLFLLLSALVGIFSQKAFAPQQDGTIQTSNQSQ